MLKKIISPILFGNYFISFCVVMLTVETSMILGYSFNNPLFYCLLFFATQVFYTSAYIEQTAPSSSNRRAAWYFKNKGAVLFLQYLFGGLLIVLISITLFHYGDQIGSIELWQYLLISLPVLGALLYYGLPVGGPQKLSLRYSGWFKPFAIAFVWACIVTIYPVFFRQIESASFHFDFTRQLFLIFCRNFIFISLIAILFDIKDYKDDYNNNLKTFIVRLGPNKTLGYIIAPLLICGVILELAYTDLYQPHFWTVIVTLIPYLLLLWIAITVLHRKSIFFYLLQIDGMLLVKAACGITGFLIFKKLI